MKIAEINDLIVRAAFESIEQMSEEALQKIGLNSVIRDRLLSGLIIPDQEDGCWLWAKSHIGKGSKARGIIHYRSRVLLVYRVLMALLFNKHVDEELNWILHECPLHENPRCSNPRHLIEATTRQSGHRENCRYRSLCRTLHGDRNGSRRHPESRPRGVRNPKSQFKESNGARVIQMLRATYDSAKEKRGMIEFLVRFTGKSRNAVTGVVKRWRYNDVADDPAAALDSSLIKVNLPGDSAKRRTSWPAADEHSQSRMPLAAKREFVILFHRTPKRAQKRVLLHYLASRYFVKVGSLQSIGYRDPRDFGAPGKMEILALPKIQQVTPELLDAAFAGFLPLRRKGGVK